MLYPGMLYHNEYASYSTQSMWLFSTDYVYSIPEYAPLSTQYVVLWVCPESRCNDDWFRLVSSVRKVKLSELNERRSCTNSYTSSTIPVSATPPVPQHSLLHHQYHNTLCYTTSTATLSATPPIPQQSLLHQQYHYTLCYTTSTTTLSATPLVTLHSLLHHQYYNIVHTCLISMHPLLQQNYYHSDITSTQELP